jgi:hypothetical protein
VNFQDLVAESKRFLTKEENIGVDEKGKIKAYNWLGRQQLQHVDMIFRLYLPLYALLKQTD